jgi:hypothetical protein
MALTTVKRNKMVRVSIPVRFFLICKQQILSFHLRIALQLGADRSLLTRIFAFIGTA